MTLPSLIAKISFFLFAADALLYLSQIIFQKKILLTLGHRLLLAAFIVQTVGFGLYVNKVGYPFLLEAADSYLFSAWILAGLFLLLCFKPPFERTGVFFLPAILVLYILGHFTKENYLGATGLIFSPWASIHIVFAFLAFTIFFLSFIIGVLFLFQELQLKRKKMWRFFDRLPSLEVLDQLHYKALTVGFFLLTFGIITGSAWARAIKGVYFFDDPRQLWSITAWLIYAFFFHARFSVGWRGRRGVLLSLLGFAVILFTFLEVRHV